MNLVSTVLLLTVVCAAEGLCCEVTSTIFGEDVGSVSPDEGNDCSTVVADPSEPAGTWIGVEELGEEVGNLSVS